MVEVIRNSIKIQLATNPSQSMRNWSSKTRTIEVSCCDLFSHKVLNVGNIANTRVLMTASSFIWHKQFWKNARGFKTIIPKVEELYIHRCNSNNSTSMHKQQLQQEQQQITNQCARVSWKSLLVEICTRKSNTFLSPNALDHFAGPWGWTKEKLEGIAQVSGVSLTPINKNPPVSVSTSHHA